MNRRRQGHPAAEKVGEALAEGRCCCMCGDVGFLDDLLPCPVCTRLQHTYCSSMYPKIVAGRWRCEWCLHNDPHHRQESDHPSTPTTHKQKACKRHRKRGEDASDHRRRPKCGGAIACYTEAGAGTGKNDGSPSPSMALPGCDRVHCMKPDLNPPSPRLVGRRYKLLADVI